VTGRAATGLVALLVAAFAPGAPAWADTSPVDRSRQAAARVDFTGDVRVQWVDGVGRHETVLTVRAADGVISVQGPRAVVAERHQRLVGEGGAGWRLVWQEALPATQPPAPAGYRIDYGFGPVVAGRLTRLVQIAKGGVLRERLLVDAGSGLILRREQYDGRGALRRLIAFERIRLGPGAVPHPARVRDDAPRPMSSPPSSGVFRAPARLAGGYTRIGTYRRDGSVHVVYSDGIYGLSLFEQRGRLPRGYLAQVARPVAVGRATGWHLVAPAGDVVVWQAGEAVYSVVGEAPAEEVLAAARSVPWPPGPSLLARVRRACRALLGV
jgi:hypothetical protein